MFVLTPFLATLSQSDREPPLGVLGAAVASEDCLDADHGFVVQAIEHF